MILSKKPHKNNFKKKYFFEKTQFLEILVKKRWKFWKFRNLV